MEKPNPMHKQVHKPEHYQNLSTIKLGYIERHMLGKDVLDVGASYCYYSTWICEQKADAKVVAIDQLDINPSKITFIKSDLENPIPLESNRFSTVLAFDIIEHVTNESQLINELFRVCKPGGVLIGSVPHDHDDFLPSYNLTFNHRSDLTHKRYYLPKALQEKLQSAGFTDCIVNKEGGVSPQVMAEFFPAVTRPVIKKGIGALRRLGIVNAGRLSSDLFFVAHKPA